MKVIDCDIYRDGGSYGACLEHDGEAISVFLQVEPWDHPRDKQYGSLFVSNGKDPDAKEREIRTGSLDEQQWIDRLLGAEKGSLAHDAARDTDGQSATLSGALSRYEELLAILSERRVN